MLVGGFFRTKKVGSQIRMVVPQLPLFLDATVPNMKESHLATGLSNMGRLDI